MKKNRTEDWFPKQEGGEDIASSLHQRTEELYQIPSMELDSEGLIECPVIILRDIVVFPRMISPIFITPGSNLLAIQEAQYNYQTVIALVQADPDIEEPEEQDFLPIGIELAVGRLLSIPDGNSSALVQGRKRVEIVSFTQNEPFYRVKARPLEETSSVDKKTDALMRTTRDIFERCVQLDHSIPEEAHLFTMNISEPGWLADMVATALSLPFKERQTLHILPDSKERLKRVN